MSWTVIEREACGKKIEVRVREGLYAEEFIQELLEGLEDIVCGRFVDFEELLEEYGLKKPSPDRREGEGEKP